MDDGRFDGLARTLAGAASRRSTLAVLLGGLTIPLLPTVPALARKPRDERDVEAEKRKKKKCPTGLITCKVKKGKKKKITCVDGQTDPLNCGACGQICPTGQACCGGTCIDTKSTSANCGTCGNVCTLPQTCGGGGTLGTCGCTLTTCAAQGKNCGSIPDGCGNTLNCGTCNGGTSGRETCGGGGIANVCGCRPNGFIFPVEEDSFNCDPCCSGDCCSDSPGFAVCAGGCG